MSSEEEQRPVRHFSRKHRVIAWISENVFDGVTYTVRHGLLQGMRRKGGLGWAPAFLSQSLESAEIRFWRDLDLKGAVVYDVGAFCGMLTLFFARQAARVVAYEPNSKNRARLIENIELNNLSNVTVRNVGAGSANTLMTMSYDPLMGGGAKLQDSQSAPSNGAGLSTEEITLTTLDSDRAAMNLPAPDFIKIDIEGWELEALRGARQTLQSLHPALFLEMHGDTLVEKRRKTAEIVDFLEALGYDNIVHVETGTSITADNAHSAAIGHLYCRRTAPSGAQ